MTLVLNIQTKTWTRSYAPICIVIFNLHAKVEPRYNSILDQSCKILCLRYCANSRNSHPLACNPALSAFEFSNACMMEPYTHLNQLCANEIYHSSYIFLLNYKLMIADKDTTESKNWISKYGDIVLVPVRFLVAIIFSPHPPLQVWPPPNNYSSVSW